MRSAFTPFGPDHLVVLGGLLAVAVSLIAGRRRLRPVSDRWIRWGMAAVLVGNELAAFGLALASGVLVVPLQLCDLAAILTVWALLAPRPGVSRVAYCWGLAGSVQAILTPDLRVGFPDYWWAQFFVSHCGVVVSVIYLAVTGRVGLTHRAVVGVWLLTNLYAAVMGGLNWAFGANFGYLAHKPMQPSLLDYAGPWPYYILAMEAIALVSLYLCYMPFVLARRSRGS